MSYQLVVRSVVVYPGNIGEWIVGKRKCGGEWFPVTGSGMIGDRLLIVAGPIVPVTEFAALEIGTDGHEIQSHPQHLRRLVMFKRTLFLGAAVCVLMLASATVSNAGDLTAEAVFEQLKSMSGTWKGPMAGEGDEAEKEAAAGMEAVHEFQVSAAGTVVMETMAPGTEYEMINMYHLDGEDLVLTHYCAGGNQPTMRLDREASSESKLIFEFTGGTNLNPEVDNHIHSAELKVIDDNHIDSIWQGYAEGKPAGLMTFSLARAE